MKKKSKKIINILVLPTLMIFGAFVSQTHADVNFGDGLGSRIIPNCSLRKEYNYFMNQWTTNEVCQPQVVNVPEATTYNQIQNKNATGNIYLGNIQNSYTVPAASVYSGYYTGNNVVNYGSAANYLLSSFGTGGYYNSVYYPSNTYYWSGYTVPSSVYYYTPSIFTSSKYYYNYEDSYYKSSGGGSGGSSGNYGDGGGTAGGGDAGGGDGGCDSCE